MTLDLPPRLRGGFYSASYINHHAAPLRLFSSTTGLPRASLGAPARTQASHLSSKACTSGVLAQFRSPRFCTTDSVRSSSCKVYQDSLGRFTRRMKKIAVLPVACFLP